jgi:aspartate aminotransferase
VAFGDWAGTSSASAPASRISTRPTTSSWPRSRRSRRGKTKYTAVDGIARTEGGDRAKFKRENGLDYKPSQITVGTGGKQVLFNALMATLNPGRRGDHPGAVLGELSGHGACWRAARRWWSARRSDGFKLQPDCAGSGDHAEDQVADPQLAVEPDGRGLYARRAQGADRRAGAKHPHVWVHDRRHVRAPVYDDFEFTTPAQVEPKLYERTLTVNGVSKAYCMTGWRIGYAAARSR